MIQRLAERYNQQDIENMTLYFLFSTQGISLFPELGETVKLTEDESKAFGIVSR